MGAFEYQAMDSRGKVLTGVLEGDAPRQIRMSLREKGLAPLTVEEVTQKESRTSQKVWTRGVSATDLALLTRQLATLVRSALPLDEILQAVSEQTEKPRLKSMLMAVRTRVVEGHTLADGLSDFPHIFPEIYRTTVAAGEHSGHLDLVLERLADYTERRQQMRQKILLALFYPAILTMMALLVTGGLLAFVVPEVVSVFENVDQSLPALTQGLIALSGFLQAHGILILVFLIAAVTAFKWSLGFTRVRLVVHQTQLRLPLVSRLYRGFNSARFARTLSILSASGVPLLEAMQLTANVMSNLPMREAVNRAAQRVREGSGIKAALEESGYFPPMTLHLIASGEASGKLDEMLERAAENQEREIETMTATVLGIFEPMLILLMGAMVMMIVVAILLPIFELNQLIR